MIDNICRGKRTDNGEWVVGSYLCLEGNDHRIATSCLQHDEEKNLLVVCAYQVNPGTIGQYAFRSDQTGKEIFVGDLIQDEGGSIAIVAWNEDLLQIVADFGSGADLQELNFSCRVIGNVHDSSEEL